MEWGDNIESARVSQDRHTGKVTKVTTDLVEKFVQAWRRENHPQSMEGYLNQVSANERRDLFEELLLREIELRTECGDHPSAGDYLARFPQYHDVILRRLPEETVDRTLDSTQTAVPPTPPMRHSPPVSTDDHAAAQLHIPGYEIIRRIAAGGMGVVLLARQVELGRLVALKMIKGGVLADREQVERFHAEARAVAALEHPNIISVHDVGVVDGQCYFSMSFIDGPSLAEHLREGPLDGSRAAQLLRTIARAVAYAHRKGVVHRDLKPANVLLAVQSDVPVADRLPGKEADALPDHRSTESFRPIVTDFGLAKRADAESGMTQTGQILGTPSYMPPEQALGQSDIGPAADIYSLGAILYAALTGRPPFQAARVVETLRMVTEAEPLPPRQLVPHIDRDLETICLKCLEKAPDKRYESADALAADLDRYLNGDPIVARPVGALERTWRWCRRRPAVALLAALLLILAIAGPWTALVQARLRSEADRHRRTAERTQLRFRRERDRANDAAERARRATRQAEENYAKTLDTSLAIAAERAQWKEVLELTAEAERALPSRVNHYRLVKCKALFGLTRIKELRSEVERLWELEDKGEDAAEITLWWAEVNSLQGEIARARDWFIEAIELKLPPAEEAYARSMLAETTPEAIELLQRAIEIDPFHQRAYAVLAVNLVLLGRRAEAAELARTGRRLFPQDSTFSLVKLMVEFFENDSVGLERAIDDLRPRLPQDIFNGLVSLLRTLHEERAVLLEWDEGGVTARRAMRLMGGFWQVRRLLNQEGGGGESLTAIKHSPTVMAAYSPLLELFSPWKLPLVLTGNLDIYEPLKETAKRHPDGWFLLINGVVALIRNQPREAIPLLEEAARRPHLWADTEREPLYALAMAHMMAAIKHPAGSQARLDELKKSIEPAQHYVRSGDVPDRRVGYLVRIARRSGEFSLAQEIIDRKLQVSPNDHRWLLESARIAQDQRSWVDAMRHAEEVLKQQADSEEAKSIIRHAREQLAGLVHQWEDESKKKATGQ